MAWCFVSVEWLTGAGSGRIWRARRRFFNAVGVLDGARVEW